MLGERLAHEDAERGVRRLERVALRLARLELGDDLLHVLLRDVRRAAAGLLEAVQDVGRAGELGQDDVALVADALSRGTKIRRIFAFS